MAAVSLTPWRTFVETCHLGSLSAAAERLGYTQSAMSRQIASLERDIGVALLHRLPRGIRPTAAGEALLPHARLIIAEAERGRQAACGADKHHHLAIGAVPSAAGALVPRAIRQLSNPPSWSMLTDLTPRLLERVTRGELDLAVVTDMPSDLSGITGVEFSHLFDDPMGVVVPEDHALAHRRRVRITDLAEETWIEDNPGSEALLHRLAARHDVTLRVDRSTFDLTTKVAMVAAGHGVALVPRTLAPSLRRDVRLMAISNAPRRGVYLAARPGRADVAELVSALITASRLD